MSIVPQALDMTGDARFDRELQMDQRKPAAPLPASEMSREGGAGSCQDGGGGERACGDGHLPPSTERICPVTHAAYGDAKNTTAFAMSSGVPKRFSAIRSTSARCPASP